MGEHFAYEHCGSIVLLTPVSDVAREWVAENVAIADWQRHGEWFAVEPRCGLDLLRAFAADAGVSCD